MWGILFAILAGLAISFQNIVNTKMGNTIGTLATTTVVHFVGFLTSLLLVFLFGALQDFKQMNQLPWPYFLGGAIGVVIVFSIITSITKLGAGYAVAIMIIVQLFFSFLADTFGLFGLEKVPVSFHRILGMLLLVVGVLLFQTGKK